MSEDLKLQDYVEILGEPDVIGQENFYGTRYYQWDIADYSYHISMWSQDGKIIKVLVHPKFTEEFLDSLTDSAQREKLLFNLDLFNDYEIQRVADGPPVRPGSTK